MRGNQFEIIYPELCDTLDLEQRPCYVELEQIK